MRHGYRLAMPVRRVGSPLQPELIWDCLSVSEARRLYHYEHLLATRKLPGSFVECGVALGDSLIFAMMISRTEGIERDFWGFDTFEGFPSTSHEDGRYLVDNPQMLARYRTYSFERITARLRRVGITEQDFGGGRLVKGLIPTGFADDSGVNVALLHIDLDLFRPTFDTLEFFLAAIDQKRCRDV